MSRVVASATAAVVATIAVVAVIAYFHFSCKAPIVYSGENEFMGSRFYGLWLGVGCVKGKLRLHHVVEDVIEREGSIDLDDGEVREFIATKMKRMGGRYHFPLEYASDVRGKRWEASVNEYTFSGVV